MPEALPPVTVTSFSARLPPAPPLIVMIRNVPLPAIVEPEPLILIDEVTTGSPVAPSGVPIGAVSAYVQPDARLTTPPPPGS